LRYLAAAAMRRATGLPVAVVVERVQAPQATAAGSLVVVGRGLTAQGICPVALVVGAAVAVRLAHQELRQVEPVARLSQQSNGDLTWQAYIALSLPATKSSLISNSWSKSIPATGNM
jgi:ABC-type sulfate transport system permease component